MTTPIRSRRLTGTPMRSRKPSSRPSSPLEAPAEEGIQVAIRMRPLHAKEQSHHKVWKVLSKYASVAQTTTEGKPLPERLAGRNFFTYDQTFDETSSTQHVYRSLAQPIVLTACTGRNGTIFAYGQTSSGKTYTMQGAGTIAEGSCASLEDDGDSGGFVHLAARDLFQHIAQHSAERVFVVRASFLEIYNEEVRDLLQEDGGGNKVLQIREDPKRGVFVQSKEVIVTDANALLDILFQGEKSRSFASTAMNERSSRSHTIFRITIESRSRQEDDEEDENLGAVLVSTLNLVDLAGSESVRHTGATGDRQKEGGLINQSLLTLSRVIVALGTPNSSHINFRDSKLTRILQPSLSGNARMAVVCCATPSELYLEETRSTLLFASRAKLVKTNAQVNEVLDDRSIIRRLQRELALARSQQSGGGHHISANVEQWELLAASAGNEAKEAKEKLKRLYTSILMNQKLDDTSVSWLLPPLPETQSARAMNVPCKKRRRLSDGNLGQPTKCTITTPSKKIMLSLPSSVPAHNRPYKATVVYTEISTKDELSLLREAVVAKDKKVVGVQQQMDVIAKQLQRKDLDLVASNCSNDLLRSDRDEKSGMIEALQSDVASLQSQLAAANAANEALRTDHDIAIEEFQSKLQNELQDRRVLEETVDSLQEAKVTMEREMMEKIKSKEDTIAQLSSEIEVCRNELLHQTSIVVVSLQEKLTETENKVETLSASLEESATLLQSSESRYASMSEDYTALEVTFVEREEAIQSLTQQHDAVTDKLQETSNALLEANTVIHQQSEVIGGLGNNISICQEQIRALTEQNDALMVSIEQLKLSNAVALHRIGNLEGNLHRMTEKYETVLKEKDVAKDEAGNLSEMLQISSIQLEGLVVALKHSESGMEEVSTRLSSVLDEKLAAEALISEKEIAFQRLQAHLSVVASRNDTVNEQLIKVAEDLKTTKERCERLSAEAFEFEQEKLQLMTQTNQLQGTNKEMVLQISNMEQKNQQLSFELHAVRNNMMKTNEMLQRKIVAISEDASSKIDVLTILLHRGESEKDAIALDFSALKNSCSDEHAYVEALNHQYDSYKLVVNERINVLTAERDDSLEQLAFFSKMLMDSQTKLEGLTVAFGHSEKELCHVSTERSDLKREFIRYMNLLQMANSQVESLADQNQTLSKERSEASSRAHDLTSQVALLKADFEALEAEKKQLEEKLSTVIAENTIREEALLADFQKKYSFVLQALEDEKSRLSVDLQEATSNISVLKITVDQLTIQNGGLLATLKSMEANQASIENLNSAISILQRENTELKQLLANANNCVNEARCNEKDLLALHNDTTNMLALAQEQLQAKEMELQFFRERTPSTREDENDLQKVLKEKNYLEKRLQEEIADRNLCELELKRQMSEEQRILIQEAEETMRGIRSELESQRLALQKSEAEAYASRELKDELEDQYRRTLDRALQMESQIASLQKENVVMHQAMKQKEKDFESDLSTLREQLSLETSEVRSSRLQISDFENKFFRLNKEKSMIELELSRAQESLTNRQDVKIVEEKNKHLLMEVERLGRELIQMRNSMKENVLPQEKLKELEGDNEQLRKKLKSYVDRCEKLESSKLTKDKLKSIQKIMDDKAKLENELQEAKQEIEVLQTKVSAGKSTSNSLEDSEVTKLRFDKEALEKKLRKFAAHSQRLEDEKVRIMQTLRSSKPDGTIDDIEKEVVSLCDKIASLEEECDALSKYKNKAIYSSSEIESLQSQNNNLKNQVSELRKKLDHLAWTETGNNNLIASLRKSMEKLQRDADQAREATESLQNEKRSKVLYLEQENLQLMFDYKAAKKQVHELKAELSKFQISQPPAKPIMLHTSKTPISLGRPPTARSTTQSRTPQDKENSKNRDNNELEKTQNIRKGSENGISSTKATPTASAGRENRVAARLGDAFAAGEENTQECKQS